MLQFLKKGNFLVIKRKSFISKESVVYPFSIIKNSNIDSYTYISYNCLINNVSIGKYCSIAQNVKMGLGIHPTNLISTSPIFYSINSPLKKSYSTNKAIKEYKPIIIGNDVWIGINSVIIDGVTIGDGAIVGANSLVTKNVEPYTIVGGVPAKEIRKRFSNEIIEKLLKLKWWNCSNKAYLDKDIINLFTEELSLENLILIEEKIRRLENS